MQQLLLELMPPRAATLDNFVTGGNGAAVAALRDWPSPRAPTCLLFWGETGCGRSHLLRACGAAFHDAATDPDLGALPAEFPAASRLAVDAADRLSATGQVALFNAFNRLRQAAGQLLVSTDQPPLQLPMREDLRTRLGSGLVFRLQPLTDAEKAAALRERAAARALALSDEALETLFRHSRRDMATLSALIDALDRFTLEHRRPLTLPLLRQLLASQNQPSLPI